MEKYHILFWKKKYYAVSDNKYTAVLNGKCVFFSHTVDFRMLSH